MLIVTRALFKQRRQVHQTLVRNEARHAKYRRRFRRLGILAGRRYPAIAFRQHTVPHGQIVGGRCEIPFVFVSLFLVFIVRLILSFVPTVVAARAFASKDVEILYCSPTVRKNGGSCAISFIFVLASLWKFHGSGLVFLVVVLLHKLCYCMLMAGSDDFHDSRFCHAVDNLF